MALDGELVVGVIFQHVPQFCRIGCERFQGIGTKRSLVVVEISIFDFSQKLVNPGASRGVGIPWRRCRGGGMLRRGGARRESRVLRGGRRVRGGRRWRSGGNVLLGTTRG